MQLTIDDEFKNIIPAQSAEECAALETSLLAEGCRDALVVWQGHNILIDGHHRYDICTRHNIPFKIVEREFASREDVIIWMVDNQLARRNLELFQRAELAFRKEDAISLLAKQNMSLGGQGLLNSTTLKTVHTRKEVATDANTSEDTVRKVKAIKKTAPEVVKKQARSGELTVNRAFEITKALQPIPAEFHDVIATNALDNLERVQTMARLYKSAGSMETNGTFYEIIKTGGFFYGDDMDKWCDFWKDSNRVIDRALQSVSKNHRIIAKQTRIADLVQQSEADTTDTRIQIIHGDFVTVCAALEANSVNCILTDPPYPREFLPLWSQLGEVAARVLKPGGFLVSYTGQSYLPEVMTMLGEHLTYYWLGGLHHIGDQARRFERNVQNAMKPILVYQKPPFTKPHKMFVDLVDSPASDKEYHAWGQSLQPVVALLETFTLPDDLILDPFSGGGTTALACQQNHRRCIAVELDENTYKRSMERLYHDKKL